MKKTEKIVITDYSDKPLILSREPWGEDYTLKPEEKFEISGEDCGDGFYYDVCCENDYIAVWADGGKADEYPGVYSAGVELQCGYNRNLSPIK